LEEEKMSGKTKAQLELENGKYRAKLEGLYDNLGDFLGIDDEDDDEEEGDEEFEDNDYEEAD
jgi:hypothetical protein